EVLEKQTKERYRLVALIVEAQKRNDKAEEERLLKLAENLSEKGWWLDADGYMYTIWTPLSTVHEEGQEIFGQIKKIAERLTRLKATKAGRLQRLDAIREQIKMGGARLPVESFGAARVFSADPVSSAVIIPAILFGVIVMKQNRPGARLSDETIPLIDFTALADEINLSDRLLVVGNLELTNLSPDQAVETALNFISRLNASVAGVGAGSSVQNVITLDVAASGMEVEVLEGYKSAIEKRTGNQTQIIITDNVVAAAYEQADLTGAQPVVIEFSAGDSLLKIDSKILSAYELHLARQAVKLDAVQLAVYRQIEAVYETVTDTTERERLIALHKFEFSVLLLSDFGVFSSATAQFLKDQAVEQDVLLRAFAGQFDGINVPTSVTAVLDYTTFSQLQSLNPTLDGQMIQQRMLKEQTGADSRIVWLFKDEAQRQEALKRPDLRLNIRNSVVSSAEETAGIIEAVKAQGIAIGPNEEAIVIQLTSPERKLSRSESSDVYVLEVEPDLKTDSTGFFLLRGYDISILKERIKTEAVPGIEVFVDENGRLSIKLKAVKIDWNSIMTTLRLSITATSIAA
ncbi:MAG: hypothetical protein KC649_03025, partial [Candidatus Omnitrophica bacterium]|nr:hypothetical protein [Candidatus Omnitrophota bacterium]